MRSDLKPCRFFASTAKNSTHLAAALSRARPLSRSGNFARTSDLNPRDYPHNPEQPEHPEHRRSQHYKMFHPRTRSRNTTRNTPPTAQCHNKHTTHPKTGHISRRKHTPRPKHQTHPKPAQTAPQSTLEAIHPQTHKKPKPRNPRRARNPLCLPPPGNQGKGQHPSPVGGEGAVGIVVRCLYGSGVFVGTWRFSAGRRTSVGTNIDWLLRSFRNLVSVVSCFYLYFSFSCFPHRAELSTGRGAAGRRGSKWGMTSVLFSCTWRKAATSPSGNRDSLYRTV